MKKSWPTDKKVVHGAIILAALFANNLVASAIAAAANSVPAAVFGFELDDTSLQGEMQGSAREDARLAQLDAQLRTLLARHGYAPLALAPVAAQAKASVFRTCGGCDVDLARRLGAQVSVTGWVQKVSNLILNVNVVMRDVATADVVHGGSVDIRGDTDQSWSRGLRYLVENRLFPDATPAGANPAGATPAGATPKPGAAPK